MISRKKRLQSFRLYAVTDIKQYDEEYIKKVEAALRGGADIVQLRSKHLNDREFLQLGIKIRALVTRYAKLFFVNDRPDMCRALDADGIHIGQDDLPVSVVRKMLSRGRLIGKSTHSVEQARRTMREDVDYIGFGPLFGTPTKPDYAPIGLGDIPHVMKNATKPVVCIGGIDHSNIDDVIAAGAERVAVVRAIFDQTDVEQAVRGLREHLK
jgi:thiamine-phosphate pyrophosphorylase